MTVHVSDVVAVEPGDLLVRDGSFILGFPAFRVKDWEFQISKVASHDIFNQGRRLKFQVSQLKAATITNRSVNPVESFTRWGL